VKATVDTAWLAVGNTLNTTIVSRALRNQQVSLKSMMATGDVTQVVLEVAPVPGQSGAASGDILGLMLDPAVASFLVASDVTRTTGRETKRSSHMPWDTGVGVGLRGWGGGRWGGVGWGGEGPGNDARAGVRVLRVGDLLDDVDDVASTHGWASVCGAIFTGALDVCMHWP
jgi:hypothetical protein